MYALGVLTTLLRAPRRRAYNLSHYKSLPSYFFPGAHLASAEDTSRSPAGRECGTKIIIRHAPRLQGETFTGLSQHQRKLSNVASEHHFLCLLGGDLQRDRLGDGRNRWLTAR